jgi:RNA polymerase sigma factor (sigma-70 family)
MAGAKTFDETVQTAINHILNESALPPTVSRDDVSQDVWVAVLEARASGLLDPADERAFYYICRIAKNEIASACNGVARRAEAETRIAAAGIVFDPDAADEDEKATWLARLASVMPKLDEQEQLMIQYHYVDGFGMSDAGRRMGWTRQWFHRRLKKLLKKLATLLDSESMIT